VQYSEENIYPILVTVHTTFYGSKEFVIADNDGYIIEVGEHMEIVVKRFIDSGLSIDETAIRMDVPIEYIQSCIGCTIGE
jgi:hypothetical protein